MGLHQLADIVLKDICAAWGRRLSHGHEDKLLAKQLVLDCKQANAVNLHGLHKVNVCF